MHLGLDVHGVIDQNLSYWKSLAQLAGRGSDYHNRGIYFPQTSRGIG